jgi:eukaryotic-like serine/threonine-protein kinase
LARVFCWRQAKKIEIAGEQIQTLCDAGEASLVRGGTWSSNGTILFASAALGVDGLFRVPATGGEPTLATRLDLSTQEATHRWPRFLPDGRHFLYNIRSGKPQNSGIYVGCLDSNEKKRILPDLFRVEYASDSLFFIRNRSLMVQPFDAKHFLLSGEPLPLIENVDISPTGYASFSVQSKEVLVYRSTLLPPKTQLTWFDEHGKSVSTVGPPGFYRSVRLSPDGNRLAVSLMDQSKGSEDLWTIDLARSTFYRLTSDRASEFSPVWSPDGTQIIFGSDRDVAFTAYQKPASGSGKEELVIEPVSKWSAWPFVEDWSQDGRYILYVRETDLWILQLFEQRKEVRYLESQFNKTQARFSPDGRYVAYTSDESGRWEIYVRPFPQASAGKWQISTVGGSQPQFSRDGKKMFYLSPDKELMQVEIRLAPAFEFGTPTALFQAPVELENPEAGRIGVQHGECYAPSLDGKHFL